MARETPARRKIREAAERHGLVIEEMDWQPIGAMVEMSGREGGWTVWFEDGGHALGYSADEVVEWIELRFHEIDEIPASTPNHKSDPPRDGGSASRDCPDPDQEGGV